MPGRLSMPEWCYHIGYVPLWGLSRTWVSHFFNILVKYIFQVCTKSLGSWFSWAWTMLARQRSYTCWKMTDLVNMCQRCIQVRRDWDGGAVGHSKLYKSYYAFQLCCSHCAAQNLLVINHLFSFSPQSFWRALDCWNDVYYIWPGRTCTRWDLSPLLHIMNT